MSEPFVLEGWVGGLSNLIGTVFTFYDFVNFWGDPLKVIASLQGGQCPTSETLKSFSRLLWTVCYEHAFNKFIIIKCTIQTLAKMSTIYNIGGQTGLGQNDLGQNVHDRNVCPPYTGNDAAWEAMHPCCCFCVKPFDSSRHIVLHSVVLKPYKLHLPVSWVFQWPDHYFNTGTDVSPVGTLSRTLIFSL